MTRSKRRSASSVPAWSGRKRYSRLNAIKWGLREKVACDGRARNRCDPYIVEVCSQSHAYKLFQRARGV